MLTGLADWLLQV